jgi:predicted nucleic acid-binding protein
VKFDKVYIDTNVIRDCIKRRKDYSLSLMKTIRQRQIECITSIYTLLELWRIEKEEDFFYRMIRQGYDLNTILRQRSNKDLTDSELNEVNARLDRFFKEYDCVTAVQLVEEGWQFALDIARTTNIEPADIMHLATALGERCDLLITGDGPFMVQAREFVERNRHSLEVFETEKAETIFSKMTS